MEPTRVELSPDELRTAIDEHRVIELQAMLQPVDDIVLYRAELEQWPVAFEDQSVEPQR